MSKSAPAPGADRPLAGIGFMVAAIGLLSVMDAAIKWLSADYSFLQILFFRNLFAFLPVLAVASVEGGLRALVPRRPWAHVGRALVMIVASVGFFYALGHMPLADAVAIGFAAPLFMTALSAPLLGERVPAVRWVAVAIGFVGVLAMLRPDLGAPAVAALVATGSALFYAFGMIATRALAPNEFGPSLVFSYSVLATLIGASTLPFVWITPAWADLPVLAALGVLGGVGHLLLVRGYRRAPVATLAPFEYTALVWATSFGFLIWSEVPAATTAIGAGLVVAGGLWLARAEARAASRT